ncbi:lipocalin-like domain-containing protein [Vibrio genomosp. F10]|uniref:lipocalin-like domain-containing protein n=1 Tax=Vibrio genomosp. F10 TaxID=723171 RepID=UPI000317446C|nr:lipocalin-like domain-containing protein [Vibrio genomosp. F10]OEF07628.1 ABC transporter [Vibrio genomosp. F10 str. 9ZB36]
MKNTLKTGKLSFIRLLSSVAVILFVSILLYLNSDLSDSKVHDHSHQAVVQMLQKKVFEPVLPDRAVTLPHDFKSHPEYQHEWWQYFANVVDQQGTEYAIQWSFFRIARDERKTEGWQNPQIYISHAVISNKTQVWKEQRIARGGIGQSGTNVNPFKIWIDNWGWQSLGYTPFPGELDISTNDFSINLQTLTAGPFALLGENGYQPKHDLLPIAAFNINAPFLSVSGELSLDNGEPLKVKGSAWMSKEWGSQLISKHQEGWDWFVINLTPTETLTISRYRHHEQMPYLYGSIISNSGRITLLDETSISLSPSKTTILSNGKKIPLEWSIVIAEHGIDVLLTPVNRHLLLPFVIPYWEGPVETSGSHETKGFMQLTGY